MESSASLPTVFVVPPNAAIKCSICFGVFNNPQCAPCGCTFCKSCIERVIDAAGECPVHSVKIQKEQLRPNINAKGVVDDLLIYCKGGLQKATNGDWAPCSSGCNMWITLGKRRDHESVCAHARTVKLENSPPLAISRELRCPHADHGCLFVGSSEQELLAHLNTCGYVHMLNQIRALTAQITMRDQEILRLNAVMAQESRTNEFHIKQTAQQILSSVSSKLERIDENSQRVLEEARSSMLKTKSAVQNSTAFQQSLTAISNLRQAVEQAVSQARVEILAKFNELELAAGRIIHKERSAPSSPSSSLPSYELPVDASADGSHNNAWNDVPVPASPSSPSSSASEQCADLLAEEEEKAPPAAIPPVVEQEDDDVDEEIRAFLLVSKEAYKREQEARAAEEAQIQQALRLSLLDARSGQK